MKSSKTPRPSKPYNTGAATSSGTMRIAKPAGQPYSKQPHRVKKGK